MGSTTSASQVINKNDVEEKSNEKKLAESKLLEELKALEELQKLNVLVEELQDVPKKQVMVVGCTGTGKSIVVNMLYNNDVNYDSCTSPARVGDTSDSVTKEVNLYYNRKSKVSFLDTIGLSDPKMTDIEVVLRMRHFLREAQTGIHLVIVVIRWGRINAAERFNLEALSQLFEKDWKQKAVLVVTHYKKEFSENYAIENDAIKNWIGEDKQTKDFVSGFSKVIVTENAIDRLDDVSRFEVFRKRMLKELNETIDHSTTCIEIAPLNFSEMVYLVLQKYFELFVKPVRHIRDIMAAAMATDIKTFAGFCPICQEYIKIPKYSVTNCGHSFCLECICRSLKSSKKCPLCSQEITGIKRYNFFSQI